jgi:hypothetical protein
MQSVIPPLLAILDTSKRRETIEVVPMVFYYVSGKNPARPDTPLFRRHVVYSHQKIGSSYIAKRRNIGLPEEYVLG